MHGVLTRNISDHQYLRSKKRSTRYFLVLFGSPYFSDVNFQFEILLLCCLLVKQTKIILDKMKICYSDNKCVAYSLTASTYIKISYT